MRRRPLIERGKRLIERRPLNDIDFDVLTVFQSIPDRYLTNSRIIKELRSFREDLANEITPRRMADVKKALFDYGLIERERTSNSMPYKYRYRTEKTENNGEEQE